MHRLGIFLPLSLSFFACQTTPPPACEPCPTCNAAVASAPPRTMSSAPVVRPAPPPPNAGPPAERIAAARTKLGELAIERRKVGAQTSLTAVWSEDKRPPIVQELDPSDAVPLLVDVNADDVPDVIFDTGAHGTFRFKVYASWVDGEQTSFIDQSLFAWFYMRDAKTTADAAAALKASPHVGFTLPEACGALERAGKVDAFAWTSDTEGWAHAAKKTGLFGNCNSTMKDGDAYWSPELHCSNWLPACEYLLYSGGTGGTALPHETLYFFDREKGLLRVISTAENAH